LFSLPGGIVPSGQGSGLSFHHHADLGTKRLAVELDRLLAASVEEQVWLNLHGRTPPIALWSHRNVYSVHTKIAKLMDSVHMLAEW